jgi:hypothetical protein
MLFLLLLLLFFFPLSSSLSRVCVRACEALCGEGNDFVLVEAKVKLFAIQRQQIQRATLMRTASRPHNAVKR